MNSALIKPPPTAPTIGTACAAAFSETAMPKRDAIFEINRVNAELLAAVDPLVRISAAAVTCWAIAARATKYVVRICLASDFAASLAMMTSFSAVSLLSAAERKHFQASQPRFWIGQIFALGARDVGNRPQDDHGRYG